jgi:hypothetical protein
VRAVRAAPQAAPLENLPGPPLAIAGEPVPWLEFSTWLVLLQGRANVESFVLEQLLERECRAAEIRLDEAALLATIERDIEERVQNTFGGDPSLWIEELERFDQSPWTFRIERLRGARRQGRIDQLVRRRRVIEAAAVRELWESRYGAGGRRWRVSRLFLRVQPPAPPPGATRDETLELNQRAQQEVLERAQGLHARLLAGADFELMVRELSDDESTRLAGGRLAQLFEPRDWPGLEPGDLGQLALGEVSRPFFSRGGYNLLRLDAVELTPLEEVALELERELAEGPADPLEAEGLCASLLGGARVELLAELDREVLPDRERLERPVLLIDGVPISRFEFSRWLVQERGRPLVRTFMQHRVVARRAAQAGVEPTAVETEQRVQEDLERQIEVFFKGDRQAWLEDLAARGQPLENLLHVARQRARHNLRAERLLLAQRVVPADAVHAAWVERFGLGGHSLDVRYIMLGLPAPAEGSITTDEELRAYVERESRVLMDFLANLRARVQNGEDFDALVRTHSQEPASRDRGGRPPGGFQLHEWPESLQVELRALEVGGVAEPMRLGQTFYLFELAGKAHVPLAQVEAELRQELMTRRPGQIEVASWLNQETGPIAVTTLPGMYE